jgi:hypothetical protein
MSTPKEGFGFVIETNEYAGNFEREMCAFLTGEIGECEVGEEFVDDLPVKFNNIMSVPDDNGCHRPVSMDDNNINNVIIFFETEPTKKQIDFMKERAELFDERRKKEGRGTSSGKDVKILGFRLDEYTRKVKSKSI